jgi:uncharacterized protein YndB with AHSA1/START domain
MQLQFQVQAKIRKPVREVFDAVHNPASLSSFFTTGGASAPLDEGTTVQWAFHDFPGSFPVYVRQVVPNERIVLEWNIDEQRLSRIEMTFEALDEQSTRVRIAESGWQPTPEDLKRSYGNCEGWTQMLACLKCYLEHGINLREFYY